MSQGPSPANPRQWHAFAAALHVPMVVFAPVRDDDVIVDLVLVDANAAAVAQIGTGIEQLRGLHLEEAFSPFDQVFLHGLFKRITGGHLALHFPYHSTEPDGRIRSFDVAVVTFDGLIGAAWFEITNFELALDDLREARDDLAEQERRFRILAENSSDLVYELDLDERCVWISPSVESMLGWSPAALLGTRIIDLVHPDDRQMVLQHRADIPEHDSPEQLQMRLRRADGGYRWMLGRARPRREGGRIVGGYVHLTDIHDLVLTRDAFAASEARYRTLAEGTLDVVWLTSAEGLIEWVAPSVTRELGYRPEELLGHNPAEFMASGDDVPIVAEARRRLWEEGLVVEGMELQFRHRDGRPRWMSVRARPLRDIDGRITAAIVAMRDIDAAHRDREALAASEARFRILAEHASDVVCQIDARGVIQWVSPSVERELGYLPEELTGRFSLDLVHPDDRSAARAAGSSRDAGTPVERIEVRYLARDGSARWMSVRADPVAGDDDSHLVVALRDVDREHRARDDLARSEAQFRMLAENVSDVIVEFDHDLVCRWISPSVEWILGWPPRELTGDTLVALAHPSEQQALLASWHRMVETATPQELQFRVRTSAGAYRWMLGRTRPRLDDTGAVIGGISSFTDIDDAVRAGEEYAHAARHDSLTGLANRAGLLDEIERALAGDRRAGAHTAVLVIDLDHFKDVNDSLGHPVGDRLLSAAAQRLRDCVRAGEFLARPGGDEFTVVLRGLDDPASAALAAQRIVDAFRTPFVFAGTELSTTASVGIVCADPGDGGVTADTLLRDGDRALYHAKELGRDRWVMFNAELRERLEERLRLERELRGALERDEFELCYQPEVDLATGALIGVEALLRWHHPSGDLHPAARFIQVAEDTGLILQIGTWALRVACHQAAEWATRFPERPVVMRCNISTRQLSEPRLLDEIDDVLRQTAVPPGRLCVEIAETALLRSSHVVSENLRGLRRRGLCLAFDGFGAGASSLTSLRDFPVDRLTLDRELVADITEDELDRNIVAGVIGLAQRLSLPVTARGIERREQAEMLAELGCERGQGHLYAPALPAAAIEEMLSGR